MRRRRIAAFAIVAVTVALSVPTVAEAGAPNYECGAGPWRYGIDQHRRAGLVRGPDHTMLEMPLFNGNQDGSTLSVTMQDRSVSLRSDITEMGQALTLTVVENGNSMTYKGSCAFVPGNFVLGHVTGARADIRTRASRSARVFATAGHRSIVWTAAPENSPSVPHPTTHGGWARVRVVSTLRGGPQQLGIGNTVGLDGPNTIAQGWGRVDAITFVTART